MLIPGLASVTFRALPPPEIIRLAVEAGLHAIEWDGAGHVPAGKLRRARDVGRLTRGAGLIISAYNSPYCLGGKKDVSFDAVLETAAAMDAPTIRIRAGARSSIHCSREERRKIVKEAFRFATSAAHAGIAISLECQDRTLADTQTSIRALLQEITHPNIYFLWQPPLCDTVEACASQLVDVLPRLRDVHVFHSWPTTQERLPLIEGESRWRTYIDIVRMTGRRVDLLLKQVCHDSPAQLLADAAVLRRFLDGQPVADFSAHGEAY